MPAVEDGEVTKQHIAAILQGDRFVADASLLCHWSRSPTSAQSLPPDQASSDDGDVLQPLSPDQAVVPVIMFEILIRLPRRIRFGRIIRTRSTYVRIRG